MRVALQQLAERLPGLRLAADPREEYRPLAVQIREPAGSFASVAGP